MYLQLIVTCFLLPLTVIDIPHFTSVDDAALDFNELMSHSDLVIIAQAVADESIENGRIIEQYHYFEILESIKGGGHEAISIKTHALYQGDIVHEVSKLTTYEKGATYLLFLPNQSGRYDADDIIILKESAYNGESSFALTDAGINQMAGEKSQHHFNRESLLNAISSFHFNEIEIIEAEISVNEK